MIGELVTVTGGLSYDENGDPVPGSGAAVVRTLAPLEFLYSTESSGAGRAGVVVGAKVYLPAGTVVTHESQVTARGLLFEVDGEVADWRSGAGSSLGGLEVALKRAVG